MANLSRRDLLVRWARDGRFKHVLIRDVAYESMPRSERARLHMQLAGWLERRRDAEPQTVAGHYASAVSLGTAEARPGGGPHAAAAPRRRRARCTRTASLCDRHGLAQSLANDDRERALAAEAVGDAYWMAEQFDDALDAYGQALEHGHRAGLGEHDMAQLSWKWVDLPTRWGGLYLRAAPTREAIEAEIADGLRQRCWRRGAEVLQARLLVARRWSCGASSRATRRRSGAGRWRTRRSDRRAAGAVGAARDLGRAGRAGALLVALRRFDDAADAYERRMSLIRDIAFREEQMDICASTARNRTAAGRLRRGGGGGRPGRRAGGRRRPPVGCVPGAHARRGVLLLGSLGRRACAPTTASWRCSVRTARAGG